MRLVGWLEVTYKQSEYVDIDTSYEMVADLLHLAIPTCLPQLHLLKQEVVGSSEHKLLKTLLDICAPGLYLPCHANMETHHMANHLLQSAIFNHNFYLGALGIGSSAQVYYSYNNCGAFLGYPVFHQTACLCEVHF